MQIQSSKITSLPILPSAAMLSSNNFLAIYCVSINWIDGMAKKQKTKTYSSSISYIPGGNCSDVNKECKKSGHGEQYISWWIKINEIYHLGATAEDRISAW